MLPAYELSPFNVLFFVVYLIIGIYVIVNRAIAVVYTNYKNAAKEEALDKYTRKRKAMLFAFTIIVRDSALGAK